MKILHMISGGDVGGAKTHVLSLLERLGKTEDVLLVCFMDGPFAEEARALGIRTEIVSHRNPLQACRELRRRIAAEGFQIVHCHGARANMIGMMLQHRISAPIVTTVHSDYRLDYMGRPIGKLTFGTINTVALRAIRYHIGVSDSMCNLLIARGFDPQSMFTIYNGVDFAVAPPTFSRDAYLASIGLTTEPNSTVFGIAARLNPVKDIPSLIRAFAMVVKERPECRLIIAGDGSEESTLKALAKELCPAGTVAFPGWITDTDSFYNALDVNMLTSLSETFPYALTEGIRRHCACIASAVGGVPRLIENGVTGLLFSPGDVNMLASHMLSYAVSPEKRLAAAEKLYMATKRDFSIDVTVSHQKEIYEAILRRQQRTAKRDGVLICGAYGRGNAGDDAILEAILAQLRSIDRDLPIWVLSRKPKETRLRYRIGAIYTFHLPAYLRRMHRIKLYLSGGGSLIQDVTSSRSLYYYLHSLRCAHRAGCRTLMYGCGIGPVSEKNLSRSGKIIDCSADIITLRDAESPTVLAKMGVTRPDIRITADPALLLAPADPAKIDSLFLANGLEPDARYCMIAPRPWKDSDRLVPVFRAAAEYAYRRYGCIPLLTALEPGRDLAVCKQIAGGLSCPHAVLEAPQNGAITVGLMQRMQFVVAMRLHALIFAAGQGIPLIGCVYDPKVRAFLDALGSSRYAYLASLTEESLTAMIDDAVANPDSAHQAANLLRVKAEENRAAAKELLEDCMS